MRIGYVCSDADVPVFGSEGCSIHVQAIIRAMAAQGHEITALCSSIGEGDPGALPAELHEIAPDAAEAVAWDALEREPAVINHHLERDLRSLEWNRWVIGRVPEIFDGEAPDLIYERYALFGWAGQSIARREGIPHVLEVNAPLCDEQMGYERFTLTETARRLEAEVVAGADAVIAVSPWLRDWAVELGADPLRVQVVPNGVDAELFHDARSAAAARARHGLEGRRVVGYVGSFQPWHHLGGLLSAFADLAGAEPDLHLLLVGDGPGRSGAAERATQLGISGSVTFTGHLSHEAAAGAMAAMDVAVVPYGAVDDFYFSPLKLFECMAAGRPTVAAALGQIADVVDDGRTGVLYAPGDQAALAAALASLLRDPDRARAIGAAGRAQVLSAHTWDAVAERVAAVGADLLVGVGA